METKHYIVAGLIILVALAAGILSAWQYLDAEKKESANQDLQERIGEMQKSLLLKAEALSDTQKESLLKANELEIAQRENNKLSFKLIEEQNRINELQSETIKKLAGFGFLKVDIKRVKDNTVRLYVHNESEYSIFDYNLKVTNQKKINLCPKKIENNIEKISHICYEENTATFKDNGINPGHITPLDYYTEFEDGEITLVIQINSKNISQIQYSIVSKDLKSHYYRIFEVNKKQFKLLEKDNHNISERRFEEVFAYKKFQPLYVSEEL